jgi:hypothetical protein
MPYVVLAEDESWCGEKKYVAEVEASSPAEAVEESLKMLRDRDGRDTEELSEQGACVHRAVEKTEFSAETVKRRFL